VFVLTDFAVQKILAAYVESVTAGNYSGPFVTAQVQIFTSNTVPTNLSLLANFTLPTAPGVVYQAAGFGTSVYRSSSGGYELNGSLLEFAMTDDTVPAGYYGYIITNDASPKVLLGAEIFPNGPWNLNDTFDAIQIVPNVMLGGIGFGQAWMSH
jgi:hypothetical protein